MGSTKGRQGAGREHLRPNLPTLGVVRGAATWVEEDKQCLYDTASKLNEL